MAKYSRRNKQKSQAVKAPEVSTNDQVLIQPPGRESFSGWPMILGWIAMLIFTFHACSHMVAAGDTWVAMACGRHFVNHGVDTVEPFSANSHHAGPTEEEVAAWPGWAQWITEKVGLETVKKWHPTGWINQNWLTHVIFYKLVPKSSYADGVSFTSNALVYWKFTIYILAMVCVYFTSRMLGSNRFLAVVFSCFALFIGRSFLDIRPAGFSNLLVAVFMLILALSMYKNYLYIWLIVPLTIFWCNVHGGYIYVYIMMIPFIGLHLFTCLNKKLTIILYNVLAWPFLLVVIIKAVPSEPGERMTNATAMALFMFTILLVILDVALIFFKNRLVSFELKGVYHSIGAFFAAVLASIIVNPFHLTNITHTFVISVSKNAERWRDIHEWHPAFDWKNPVGTAVPFLMMYIIIWLAFLAWSFCMIYIYSTSERYTSRRKKDENGFQWPKINIVMIVIAALTIYMAIRSRRFIPIAGIVGCPIIAMLLTQLIQVVAAKYNSLNGKGMFVPAMSKSVETGFIAFGAIAIIFFGTWWGLKYKRVYLDPWPNDIKFTSVFMRMTASDAKPFYAMKFIKDNNLHGKMFNYWTEGGFVAWGQEPDPNTGFTPLQLFMDGRAQAAYNRTTFDEWSTILAGGRVTLSILQSAKARGENLKFEDFQTIGDYMNEQLTNRNVWCMLMPATIFNDPDRTSSYYTFKALELHPSWRLVFSNDRQRLLVNINTEQGGKIYDGILTGDTKYPDEYHENLNRAHKLLVYEQNLNDKIQGMAYAKKAFESNPTPAAMMEIIAEAARYTNLRADVQSLCEEYTKSFNENWKNWKKKDGYRLRVESARLANYYLAQIAGANNNIELKSTYETDRNFCLNELRAINLQKRW